MKTLGDTGLMPEKHQVYGNENVRTKARKENRNRLLNQISALPILTIVKKAVEMGLVRVNKCKSCEGYSITLSKHCPACSGSGVVVEEGE